MQKFASDVVLTKSYMQGTHRSISPAETLERVSQYRSAMGITRVANITGLDRIGIPVAVAVRPNSRALSVSQGKGLDLYAAKASALMESIESYHAERIDLPLRFGSFAELSSSIRITEIETLQRSKTRAFHPSIPLLWIEAYDLLNDSHLWVPFDLVHTQFTWPPITGSGIFYASSNGLASGNHILEALSHAVCEIIERDSATVWQCLDPVQRENSMLDLDTVDDPLCRSVLDLFERAEIDVAVWETTSDIGVPSFNCQINERTAVQGLFSVGGMGCHPDRSVSLMRALTEAAQGRLTMIAGARDDLLSEDYVRGLNQDHLDRLRFQVCAGTPTRQFRGIASHQGLSFNCDLDWLLSRLCSIGVQRVLAVDLTRPEFGIPVVRVIIPGLESIHSDPNYELGERALARMNK